VKEGSAITSKGEWVTNSDITRNTPIFERVDFSKTYDDKNLDLIDNRINALRNQIFAEINAGLEWHERNNII